MRSGRLTCQWTGHPCESGTSGLRSFPPKLRIPGDVDIRLKSLTTLMFYLERNFAGASHKLEELGPVSLIKTPQSSPEPEGQTVIKAEYV